MSCYITGCGAALPARVVTNAELSSLLEVSPEWMEANSGIRERRWVEAHQSASDLAAEAVREALHDAAAAAADMDYLIGCTLSPDYQVPGIAPLVQRKLEECANVPAVDLRVGCAGILYSLQLARGLIESRAARRVACFGAEAQSKGFNLKPESAELSMLFGDGAGAFVMSDKASPVGEARDCLIRLDDVLIETDGRFAEDLIVRAPGTGNGARWVCADQIESGLHYGSMQGRSVILQAVRKLADAAVRILDRNHVSIEQVGVVIPHQANLHLIGALGKKLGISDQKLVTNVDRFGNTSGASAFLALWQAMREARFQPDSYALILAFGAGFTWGAALCRICRAE